MSTSLHLSGQPGAPSSATPPVVLPGLWRGSELGQLTTATQPTGWERLDRALPGGGWPSRSLTEVLAPQPGILEWRLLGPALVRLAAQGRQIVAIAPPRHPYLPGLQQAGLDERRFVWIRADTPAERLWATEQMIKSNACGAVIAWLPQVRSEQLRRLQVGAQSCDGLVFLCCPESARHESSAAPLRVLARPCLDWALQLHILKRRGPSMEEPITLESLPGGLACVITPRLRRPSRLFRQEVPAHAMGRPVALDALRRDTALQ
ncbi:MAG: translesion DNA synthesis-associated protein ImuA [Proteobacteria bacterium]|nr:translesion DNA synthesis-associated protein ImuA [Pseudomonadota bacterium]MBS0493349.1 translesion DNA synthesis-associated protein ImuA [Pseudomonadota bacterium]